MWYFKFFIRLGDILEKIPKRKGKGKTIRKLNPIEKQKKKYGAIEAKKKRTLQREFSLSEELGNVQFKMKEQIVKLKRIVSKIKALKEKPKKLKKEEEEEKEKERADILIMAEQKYYF